MDMSMFHPYHRESETLPSQLRMPQSHPLTIASRKTDGTSTNETTTAVPCGPDKAQDAEISKDRSPSTDATQDAKLQGPPNPGVMHMVDDAVRDHQTASCASLMNPTGGGSSSVEPAIAQIGPGSIVWGNLRTWGWWPGRVADLKDFRPNKRKYANMRDEKEKKLKAFLVRRQQQAAKAPKEESGKDKGSLSKKANKPDLLLITFYGDSTWSWMTRDKVMLRNL